MNYIEDNRSYRITGKALTVAVVVFALALLVGWAV